MISSLEEGNIMRNNYYMWYMKDRVLRNTEALEHIRVINRDLCASKEYALDKLNKLIIELNASTNTFNEYEEVLELDERLSALSIQLEALAKEIYERINKDEWIQ